MKLSEFLGEARKGRPLVARGNIDDPKFASFAGTAPAHRLTKKQQQVKANQPVDPRQPQQAQQPQQPQQQQPQQEPQTPQQSPQEIQTKEAIKRAAGVDAITPQNVLDVLPTLVSKFKSDKNFVNQIVHIVGTAVSSSEEFVQSARSLEQRNKEAREQGIKQVSGKDAEIKAQKLYNTAKSLPKENRMRLAQALQTESTSINTSQVQQVLLAQIKAAVKGANPQVRKVLKARVQQAMLLPQGAKPDPNQHMRHGQPVINKAGIRPAKGPIGRVAGGIKNFLGKIPG